MNRFDAALSTHVEYRDGELAGFFSDLHKKVKKHVKWTKKIGRLPTRKLRSTLGDKIFGSKTVAKAKELEHKLEPVKRAAKIAVASYFAGPWAGELVGSGLTAIGLPQAGAYVTAAGAKLGAGTVAQAVGEAVIKAGVKTVAKKELEKKAAEKAAKAQQQLIKTTLDNQLNKTIADIKQTFQVQINDAKIVGDTVALKMLQEGQAKAIQAAKDGYQRVLKDATVATLEAAMLDIAKYPNEVIVDLSKKVQAHINQQQKKNYDAAKKIGEDPLFIQTVNQQKAEGKSAQEILQEWANSDAFKGAASAAAYETVYPALYANAIAAGMDEQTAMLYAQQKAIQIANEETGTVVNRVNVGDNLGKIALIAIPLLFATMGG